MTKLTDEQIESAAVEALSASLGGPDTDIGQARLRNLEFYNAEPKGELAPPEVMDRSDFVATDVADTVEGMLPSLMRMFVSGGDAVEFEGQGQPGAEEQAKLATAYVNHLFHVRNDGVAVIYDWFKDALIQKVGYAKVWAEEEAEDSKQKYEGQAPDQLAMLQMEGWELAEEAEVDEETGLLNFTVVKKARRKCVRVQAVAPVSMRIDVNARWDGEPAMIGEVIYRRRFEWEEDGYDLSDVESGDLPTDMETNEMLGEMYDVSGNVPHRSHELVRGAEIYIRLDVDGDGVAEWTKVTLIGEKLAVRTDGETSWDQVDDHPYVWICPIPRPHSFFGDCPADRAIEAQKLRTRSVRLIEDGLALSVNQRTYVNTSAAVNIDDVLDSRPGGIIRGQGAANTAIQPIVSPNLGVPAYQFVEWVGSWAENRTGFNRYSAGTDQNALNKTARGTELLTAKADMRLELMARFFGVGMRKLFAKMLKLAIQHQNVPEMIAIHGQFVPINPSEFRNQFNVKINVGLGSGSKEQLMTRIMAVAEVMMKLGQPAGVVRPEHVAEIIRLALEANELKNPERFVDPKPTGMPPTVDAFKQMEAQVKQQMEELQGQVQTLTQENDGLKAQVADKQGDLQLRAGELELKGMETQAKLRQADAGLEMKAGEQHERREAASRETGEVDELRVRVDELTDALSQIIAALQPQEAAQ